MRRCNYALTFLVFLCGLLGIWASPRLEPCAATETTNSPSTIDFARDIRPLLSDRCFLCHGPDAGQRATELRLDQQGSAHHLAIVPGDAANSEAMRRIVSQDPDEQMPPPDSNLKLNDSERKLLARWIDEGEQYEQHWAFVTPTRPSVPTAEHDDWSRGDLDRFVLQRLEQEQLTPSPAADVTTLLRRVSLDLTGLPPSIEEIDAFVNDWNQSGSDAAYERLVDRLLASQRYGERMAVDWLDLARYADTHGYQSDRYRAMWPWRDWVVKAFNQNLAFDDFVTWQLAGDLLPNATQEQILATAFNRNHRQTNEGGSVEEEFRAEYVADRVNTFGAAFLGLTLECCRCHDHKYDPLTQREYYQISSFFNNIDESGLYSHFTDATPTPTLSLTTPEQEIALAQVQAEITSFEQQWSEWHSADEQFQEWRKQLSDVRPVVTNPVTAPASTSEAPTTKQLAADPTPSEHSLDHSLRAQLELSLQQALIGDYPLEAIEEGKVLNRLDNQWSGGTSEGPQVVAGRVGQGVLLSGENNLTFKSGSDFTRDQPFTISMWLNAPESVERAVIFHRSQAWTDAGSRGYELLIEHGKLSAALIHFWPGNAMRIVSNETLPIDRWTHLAMRYDGSSTAAGLNLFVDGQQVDCQVIRDGLTKHIVGGPSNDNSPAVDLTLGQRFRDVGFKGGQVDEVKVYARELSALELRALYVRDAAPENFGEVLYNTSESQLLEYFVRQQPARIELATKLQELRQQRSQHSNGIAEVMVMSEQAALRPTYVLLRGAYDAPGESVVRGLPESILPTRLPSAPTRLDLARWLVDPRHPLTARVAVNRWWQALFGHGLVSTPEDFGLQGASPSHPELLDWLSIEFVESGWDVKRLLKTIAMSSTYRQSSNPTAQLLELDPENQLLARGPAGRLPAEMIRDTMLAAGGLLVGTVGGPPVKPYQPEGLWEEKAGLSYQRDTDAGSHRRSLYTYWKRTSPPPAMMTLDASNREVCVVRRQVTATPLQVLVLLNDPQSVEAARALAERAMLSTNDSSERARFIFRALTARSPSQAELDVLLALYQEQHALFAADATGSQQWLSVGDHRLAPQLAPSEAAAWSALASGLLSFDETIMKR